MIYFLLVLILAIYIFFLFTNRDKQNNSKLLIIVMALLTISISYLFSINYKQSNVDIYKEIYKKNVQIRSNIKTIKNNLPKLEEKLVSNPNDFNGWLMLGKSYSILKKYQKASKAYEVAINLRPDNSDVLREYILDLRSDSETSNKDLIEEYFIRYIKQTNDPQALLDLLSFSFNVNDSHLAQKTLEKILIHPHIKNKDNYKQILADLKENSVVKKTLLELRVSSKNNYQGYFFMILREKGINQPFATQRIRISDNDFYVKFTNDNFMIKSLDKIPDAFELIIKHSKSERFSTEEKPIEVFKMNIDDYNSIKDKVLRVTF